MSIVHDDTLIIELTGWTMIMWKLGHVIPSGEQL